MNKQEIIEEYERLVELKTLVKEEAYFDDLDKLEILDDRKDNYLIVMKFTGTRKSLLYKGSYHQIIFRSRLQFKIHDKYKQLNVIEKQMVIQ